MRQDLEHIATMVMSVVWHGYPDKKLSGVIISLLMMLWVG